MMMFQYEQTSSPIFDTLTFEISTRMSLISFSLLKRCRFKIHFETQFNITEIGTKDREKAHGHLNLLVHF